ncbi:MAG: pitrilysin family protein [Alphaproteobacteria bacterium]|nr:pitrilysin family protein [Alphaproteobacteria bacterium]
MQKRLPSFTGIPCANFAFTAAALFLLLIFALPAQALEIQEVIGPKTGVKAWLVEEHKLPIISMRMAFQGGGEQDPADKQGLAMLTMALLTEGAGPYDAAAFQKRLSDRSISMDFDVGRDELTGALKCLSSDKEEAFSLLHMALANPRFDKPEVERFRAKQLAGIRRQFADPPWQARYALFSHLFANHPYSQRILGTTQTLQSITHEDIKGFARKRLARDTMTVAVAGDITPEDLAVELDKIFVGLPERATFNYIPEVSEPKDTPLVLVRREGTQTDILFGALGPKRQDPDYYAVEIANYILGGGGFSSRLMQNLRDKKGLTYGIQTYLAPADKAGLVIGSTAIDNPKASEALALIRDTMRGFFEAGPTEKEIGAAKDYLTGAMPLALTSTSAIAAILVEMQRENLGMDYIDRYGKIIRSVTKADIDRAIERYFNPDKMTFVMVGKPEDVAPTQAKETVRQ